MNTDRNGLEVLRPDECLALLATRTLGRVGLTIAGLPAILPVYYAVDGCTVVFRTTAGSKLHAIGRGDVVCFEVDDADADRGTGWSVLIQGRAHEIVVAAEHGHAGQLGLDAPAVDGADRFVRLDAEIISGRRLTRESCVMHSAAETTGRRPAALAATNGNGLTDDHDLLAGS